MSRRVRIAVVAGGRSSEHAISLASARSVIEALDPERYDVVTLLIDETGGWQVVDGAAALLAASEGASPAELATGGGTSLVPGAGGGSLVGANGSSAGEIDVVFPVLHGPFGEDGTIQGLLETLGLPYVGAGVLGSAASMDKAFCKAVLRDAGIPVARSLVLRHGVDDPLDPAVEARIAETLGWPVFVKPANLGSSVGISKVHGPEELADALDLAYRHDEKALVEEFVAGREIECGVLGNERAVASAVGEIRPHAEWYDYGAKYDEGGSDIIVPADLPVAVAERVRGVALEAFRALELSGMARVDCFLTTTDEVLVNEVNTIPGFTSTSVYARLFEAVGVGYAEVLDRLVQSGLERHARRARYRY
ncbi:MAG TPA: D-alanine--D-alanine ligase family protein [Gaiellales bacterium]|nr:D-alanine--D-alanine ligase family protein [Gaiellales bacterium]